MESISPASSSQEGTASKKMASTLNFNPEDTNEQRRTEEATNFLEKQAKQDSPTPLMDDIDELELHFRRATDPLFDATTSEEDNSSTASTTGSETLTAEEIDVLLADDAMPKEMVKGHRRMASTMAAARDTGSNQHNNVSSSSNENTPPATPSNDNMTRQNRGSAQVAVVRPNTQHAPARVGPPTYAQATESEQNPGPPPSKISVIKIKFVQDGPKSTVDQFCMTQRYNIAPPQSPENLVFRLRDDVDELISEAYSTYVERTIETDARAAYEAHNVGLLDRNTMVITTMFEDKDEDKYISAREARNQPNAVFLHPLGETALSQMTVWVHFSGSFSRFNPNVNDALNATVTEMRARQHRCKAAARATMIEHLNVKRGPLRMASRLVIDTRYRPSRRPIPVDNQENSRGQIRADLRHNHFTEREHREIHPMTARSRLY